MTCPGHTTAEMDATECPYGSLATAQEENERLRSAASDHVDTLDRTEATWRQRLAFEKARAERAEKLASERLQRHAHEKADLEAALARVTAALRSAVEDCENPSFSDPRLSYMEVQHDVREVEEWRALLASEGGTS